MLKGARLELFAGARLLSAVLVASIIASALAIAYQAGHISSLSSELADKSRAAELQGQEIQQYATAVAAQQQEIEAKSAQLDQLNLQIVSLSGEVASKEGALEAKSGEARILAASLETQERQVVELLAQARALETEIGLLHAKIKSNEQRIADLTLQMQQQAPQQPDSAKRVRVSHYGLGVNGDGKGIVFPLEVEIVSSGTGTISVDVSNVQYEIGFQNAVRVAATVASDYAGVSISDKDIIVRFANDHATGTGDAPIKLDGSSAGAVIAGMIAIGLSDREINHSVLMTGTIKPDGTVGKVEDLEEKTRSAIIFGGDMMLVPKSQEFQSSKIVVKGVSDIEEVVRYLAAS